MTVIEKTLKTMQFGQPQVSGRMTMIPIERTGAMAQSDYQISDVAFDDGSLSISEVDESGIVGQLLARNDAIKPVLLLDGIALIGAKQNRILNTSVMVPATSAVKLPVSCVEQGRWNYSSRSFRQSKDALFAKARSRKAEFMTHRKMAAGANVSQDDLFAADQGAVWRDVGLALGKSQAMSASSNMEAAYAIEEDRLQSFEDAFSTTENQVGAIFCIDDVPIGLELVETPDLFASAFDRLVRSFGLTTLHHDEMTDSNSVSSAERFIEQLASAELVSAPSVGIGDDINVISDRLSATGLVVNDRVVHLAAFSKSLFADAV